MAKSTKALLTGRIQKCKTNPSIAHIGLATHGLAGIGTHYLASLPAHCKDNRAGVSLGAAWSVSTAPQISKGQRHQAPTAVCSG
jgi:hypothetical protein